MMALHEGSIVLDSEPGVGTTATLVFPASRVLRPQFWTAQSQDVTP